MIETNSFTKIFGNSIAKILDQCFIVGNMEQTITMLAESTSLTYKTALKTIQHLIQLDMMEETRKVGNAKTYKFKTQNIMNYFRHIGEFTTN